MAQAQSVAVPHRLPLDIQLDNRDDTVTKDSKLVNCVVDVSSGVLNIRKRPGLSNPVFTGLGAGHGMYNWRQVLVAGARTLLFVVSGGQVWVNYYNTVGMAPVPFAPIGSVTFSYGPTAVNFGPLNSLQGLVLFSTAVQWCIVPASSPWIVFGTGSATYYSGGSIGTGAVHQITDANFPEFTVPGIVYLDGTTYVMDFVGNVWGSLHLGDPTVWDPLNVIVAGTEPDGGVYLGKQLTYVVAIKEWTTQFFFDAGNPTGSPLAPVPGAMINYGCASPDTVQTIEGLMIWVATSRTNGLQVGVLDNLAFNIVSTPAVDRLLCSNSGLLTQYRSRTFKRAGQRLYILSLVNLNLTLVYNIDQQRWMLWSDANGNYQAIIAQTSDPHGNSLAQHETNGNIYLEDMDYVYPTDNGVIFNADIITPNFDGGVDRIKQLNNLYFQGDRTPGSLIQIKRSDNDFQNFTPNWETVDMNQDKPMLTGQGSFNRRAYWLRAATDVPLRLRSVGFQMDIGTL